LDIRNSALVWAEIDLGNLLDNLQLITEYLHPETKIMAVVKANAYGHGAVEITTALQRNGIDSFAVATVEEGVELRRSGLIGTILLFEEILPEQVEMVVNYNLTPTIYNLTMAELLASTARKVRKKVSVQIRIDTGMGGLGVLPCEGKDFIFKLKQLKWLRLEGVYTHLTSDYRGDIRAVQNQLAQFKQFINNIREAGIVIPFIHVASSLAILTLPETHFNMVRPGIVLYGIPPTKEFAQEAFKPVMQLKSRIIGLKKLAVNQSIGTYQSKYTTTQPMDYAIVPVGYADAFFLLTTRQGKVLVCGKRASIIGQARMNQIMIDVTQIPEVAIGDEVVIIGEQGEAKITAQEVTGAAGIPVFNCESVCLLSSRVPRVYFERDEVVTVNKRSIWND
jgi:alanine racemase